MTSTELQTMIDKAVQQGRLTRVPQGRRGHTEREMYLRTEASDVEREEDRIQRLLAQPARKQ